MAFEVEKDRDLNNLSFYVSLRRWLCFLIYQVELVDVLRSPPPWLYPMHWRGVL